jgi:hypothetical protein
VGSTQGNLLYASLCRSCHGDDGRGESALAAQLDPPVRDLTRCNFKYRSTVSGTLPSDDDLLSTLYAGIPGTRKPTFSSTVLLPSLEALVREVKRRCHRFAEEPPGLGIVVKVSGPANRSAF